MSRRKGTPCACSDDCGCSSSRGKCITAVNNISPDPNGDFNIKAGTGIAISSGADNEITIINSANPNAFVEGDNIDLIPSGDDIEIALTQDPVINGTLTVNGDIIQNGAAYETHAEKIYTRDDYIIMRDGAIAALAPGDYAGFQVKLYDGVNDGRLVIDSSGTARVGDVGDEEPLLTRDEAADLTDGDSLIWDAANYKAITAAIPSAISTALADKQPNITVVNNQNIPTNQTAVMTYNRYGRVICLTVNMLSCSPGNDQVVATGCPIPINPNINFTLTTANGQSPILGYIDATGRFLINSSISGTSDHYGTVTYMITE